MIRPAAIYGLLFMILACISCGQPVSSYDGVASKNMLQAGSKQKEAKKPMEKNPEFKLATFGSGCFWCSEAIFERLEGVEKVSSGYSGGHVDNPTYEQVCTGNTGHAESIQITYNPSRINYITLLEIFWKTHDPTTKDRQGYDIGPQYRSVIFYHDREQEELARSLKRKLDAEHIWDKPIVTEIVPFEKFWPAEAYHQNYYDSNPSKSYCKVVITPKIEKFKKIFQDRLKSQH
jgi:peptide-methionine (S)-S-oxide reductase